MHHQAILLIIYLLSLPCIVAQPSASGGSSEQVDGPSDVLLKKTREGITIDGKLDEEAWFEGSPAVHFWQHFPVDTIRASNQTEIYMTYDDQNLYVATKCYSNRKNYVITSLKRDYNFSGNDNISLLFDTYNDQNNAFLFGMNPLGVRREALISNGGRARGDFAESWDNKWFGAAAIYDGYWVAEFAIPFKTLRYQEGAKEWRFNSYRYDTENNEITTWNQIRQNQIIMDLAYMGKMIWDEPLQKPGTNISVIPYATAGAFRDFANPSQTKTDFRSGIGGDAKIGITSGLNLDLTFNPDFSQVEVDQQVTNLDRFEIFLPEKRQFFLENADLFNSFGGRRGNPFFSRRIGVAIDTATGQNVQNKILYGARLSGKLNDDLRIGLMSMQTEKQIENGLPGFNYSVAALQQRVFSRSNISAIFVNKQAANAQDFQGPDQTFNNFNRLAGLEYRLATPNNRWTGKFYYHQVFSPRDIKDKFSAFAQLEYLQRKYRLEFASLFIGEGFEAEVGFIPRRDYHLFSPEIELFFYPQNDVLSEHSASIDFRQIYKVGTDGNPLLPKYGLSDRELDIEWQFSFTKGGRASMGMQYSWVFLLRDFDPTRGQEEGVYLPAGTDYGFASFIAQFSSDSRKKFSYELGTNIGQFYNGSRTGFEGDFTYRYQPYGSIAINYGINYLKLEEPFQPTTVWLFGPKIDLTFSKKVFLTTFIQYNSQFENLNINARFQYRFAPVSDFFLVYTDNYLFDPFSQFSVRNRGLVAKVTYWLNL